MEAPAECAHSENSKWFWFWWLHEMHITNIIWVNNKKDIKPNKIVVAQWRKQEERERERETEKRKKKKKEKINRRNKLKTPPQRQFTKTLFSTIAHFFFSCSCRCGQPEQAYSAPTRSDSQHHPKCAEFCLAAQPRLSKLEIVEKEIESELLQEWTWIARGPADTERPEE